MSQGMEARSLEMPRQENGQRVWRFVARLPYGLSGFVERRHGDERQGENVHVNASIYSSYIRFGCSLSCRACRATAPNAAVFIIPNPTSSANAAFKYVLPCPISTKSFQKRTEQQSLLLSRPPSPHHLIQISHLIIHNALQTSLRPAVHRRPLHRSLPQLLRIRESLRQL